MRAEPNIAAVAPFSHRERDDDYQPIVARLNQRWRVIVCRDRLQWILQFRASTETARRVEWKSRSYCRTRQGLLRDVRYHAGEVSPGSKAVLEALPAIYEAGGAK